MKVVIFGAAGKTGKLVVERALAAGHTVTAFFHSAQEQAAPGVRAVIGDTHDLAAVRAAVTGQDAVIDTIGGKAPYKKTELEQSAARNIVDAMQQERVTRLLVISMMGVGDSKEQSPFWYEYLLQPTFLHGATPDKEAMEQAVRTSGLDFVIARPPLLTEDPATGSVHIVAAGNHAHKITRADLAQFLVDQLNSDQYLGQAVVVANS